MKKDVEDVADHIQANEGARASMIPGRFMEPAGVEPERAQRTEVTERSDVNPRGEPQASRRG